MFVCANAVSGKGGRGRCVCVWLPQLAHCVGRLIQKAPYTTDAVHIEHLLQPAATTTVVTYKTWWKFQVFVLHARSERIAAS